MTHPPHEETEQPRGSRAKRLVPRERRTEFIKLRVTPKTKKLMRRDAELLGMTVSELLLQAWERASQQLRAGKP